MAVAQETLHHLRTAGLAEVDPEIAELLTQELERLSTIVGKQETPAADEADADNAGEFAKSSFWPVTISYFNENAKSDTLPVYRMSFKLYENGITRDLTMDYGDFVLTGKLAKLELLDKKAAPACQ